MRTKTKALVLALCAVLLVVASVMGTMAYLTSQDTVTNTFTVGKVAITLDEAKVDEYGAVDATASSRVKSNTYKLIPGHNYTKDPTVHFVKDSEASYLFVKVENGLANIEAESNNIASQIIANGWAELTGVANVYYKKVDRNGGNTAVDYPVFGTFTLSDDAAVADYAQANISVTAYAVQADNFATAQAAWEAAKFPIN